MHGQKVVRLEDRRASDDATADDLDHPALDELPAGTTLLHGQYRIERFLNSGGFGITYLAKDSLNRYVVIKECFPSVLCIRIGKDVRARAISYNESLDSIIDQFLKEAHSLARLKHPNIVHVHQVFEENRTAYLAMDYIEGRDLQDLLEDETVTLKARQIEGLAYDILDAIKHVHEHGILHRDISPDNILIDMTGCPILIDFGSALPTSAMSNRALSRIKSVKDGYSPQEFYIETGEQGTWSDIYSFAATLYHAVAGHPPEMGQVRLGEMAAKRRDPYFPLSGHFPKYSPIFLAAIDKSLSVNPHKRVQTADEWLAMVARAQSRPRDRSISKVISRSLDQGPSAKAKQEFVGPSQDDLRALKPRRNKAIVFRFNPVVAGAVAASTLILTGFAGLIYFLGGDDISPAETAQAVPEVSEVAPQATRQPIAAPIVARPVPRPVEQPVEAPVQVVEALPEPTPPAVNEDANPLTFATVQARPDVPKAAAPLREPVIAAAPLAHSTDRASLSTPEASFVEVSLQARTDSKPGTLPPTLFAALIDDRRPMPGIAPAKPEPIKVAAQQLAYSHWNVVMPFEAETEQVRKAITARITSVDANADLQRAGDWIEKGVTIYAVNGEVLVPNTPFSGHILNALSVDPDGYSRATVRYREANDGDIDRGLLTVQVIREIALKDGTLLTASVRDLNWLVTVTAVSDQGANSGFQVGDILVREHNSGRLIAGHDDLVAVFDTLVAGGRKDARFEVLRAGSSVRVDYALAREKSE